jgi:YVTN family beta-propeller protein
MRPYSLRLSSGAACFCCSLFLVFATFANTQTAAPPPPALPAVPVVIAAFPSNGPGPTGVAYDPIHRTMWVATQTANQLTEYNVLPPYAIVRAVGVANPYGVAFDPIRGNVWVTDFGANTVTVVNVATGAVLAVTPVGGVHPAGVCFDGVNMWVANFNSNSVTKLNGATFAVIGVFPVLNNPQACAFDTVTGEVWITDEFSNVVTVLNLAGALVVNKPVGTNPWGIAFDGADMWVGNQGSNNVWKINGATFATLAIVAVPAGPRGVIYGVGAGTPYVWAINSTPGTLTQIMAAPAVVTGVSAAFGVTPQMGAFDPVNSNIWVADTGNNMITVLN